MYKNLITGIINGRWNKLYFLSKINTFGKHVSGIIIWGSKKVSKKVVKVRYLHVE